MKNLRILLIAAGALLMAVSVYFLGLQVFQADQAFRGSTIGTPIPPAFEFELQQPDSTPFRLADQRGKVVLIFLGYTNCPDFCPATMGKFAQIAETLGEDAANVAFVFITVDPERDTPEVIADYMDRFDPRFIGLTGSAEELQQVWNGYFVGTVFREAVEGELGYVLAHPTRVFVIDKQGLLRITFPFELTAADMSHDVQLLLAE